MTSESVPTGDSARPSPTPMPEHPTSEYSTTTMPAPSAMPDTGEGSGAGSAAHSDETTPVIDMADYPDGRGGMRMVPMEASERLTPEATRPADVPIGPRPSATEMPARS